MRERKGVTLALESPRLDGVWRSATYAFHLNATRGIPVAVCCRFGRRCGDGSRLHPVADREELLREILVEIDAPEGCTILRNLPYGPTSTGHLAVPWRLFPQPNTRTRWRAWQKELHRRVAYVDDLSWGARYPPPSKRELRNCLPGFSFCRIALPFSMPGILRTLARCDLLVAMDMGTAQMGLACGVPTVWFTWDKPVWQWWGWAESGPLLYCRGLGDLRKQARHLLGLRV